MENLCDPDVPDRVRKYQSGGPSLSTSPASKQRLAFVVRAPANMRSRRRAAHPTAGPRRSRPPRPLLGGCSPPASLPRARYVRARSRAPPSRSASRYVCLRQSSRSLSLRGASRRPCRAGQRFIPPASTAARHARPSLRGATVAGSAPAVRLRSHHATGPTLRSRLRVRRLLPPPPPYAQSFNFGGPAGGWQV